MSVHQQQTAPICIAADHALALEGLEKLNDDYEVLYKLEYRLENDGDLRNEKIKQPDGTEKTVAKTRNFEARDSWIGVKHKKYGTIKAGRMLSLDPYVRYTAYLASGVDGVRTNNTIAYESPKIKDVSFQAMYILDENKETDTIDRDGYSLLVKKTQIHIMLVQLMPILVKQNLLWQD